MDGTIDVIIPVHAETDRALESPTRPLPQSYPCSPDTEFSYLLNPAEWPILRLELRESPDTHPFLVALPFQ
jgi:hypothetical protein